MAFRHGAKGLADLWKRWHISLSSWFRDYIYIPLGGSKHHAVRTLAWRYIRYENGDEELYDETKDPLDYKNLAGDSNFADKKEELAKWLPKENKEPVTAKGEGKEKGKGKGANKKKKEDAE